MKITSPCLNCENRNIGCHGYCDKYDNFKAAKNEYNSIVYNQKKESMMYKDYKIKAIIKTKRKK